LPPPHHQPHQVAETDPLVAHDHHPQEEAIDQYDNAVGSNCAVAKCIA